MSKKLSSSPSPKFWAKSSSSTDLPPLQSSPQTSTLTPVPDQNTIPPARASTALSSPYTSSSAEPIDPGYYSDNYPHKSQAANGATRSKSLNTRGHQAKKSRIFSGSAENSNNNSNNNNNLESAATDDYSIHSLSSKFKTLFKQDSHHSSRPDRVPSRQSSSSRSSSKPSSRPSSRPSSPPMPSDLEFPLSKKPGAGSLRKNPMAPVLENDDEQQQQQPQHLASLKSLLKSPPPISLSSAAASQRQQAHPHPPPQEAKEVPKQVGNILVYSNNKHEHCLKKAKVLEKPAANYIPGAGLFSGLLKSKKDDDGSRRHDNTISVFSEVPELEFLQELKLRNLSAATEFVPKKARRTRSTDHTHHGRHQKASNNEHENENENESDSDSEPEVVDPAIDKPQAELIEKLTAIISTDQVPKAPKPGKDVKLSQEYGISQGICGRGAYGVVKILSKIDPKTKKEKMFAVKELKKKSGEELEHFNERLISEFIISLSLNHANIVKTFDLMRNSKGVYSEVLEYCDAGDLYTIILETNGEGLHYVEADCLFKQILNGVIYMHSKGIAHCDLKPENVLLTRQGTCKLIDFGTSSVFKTAFETDVHLLHGPRGSPPYVAPEEYTLKYYDPRLADVWSLGVVYMVMRAGTYLWQVAKAGENEQYQKYLSRRPLEDESTGRMTKGTYEPIELLRDGPDKEIIRSKKETIYDILEPDPEERLTTLDVYESCWVRNIQGCLQNDY